MSQDGLVPRAFSRVGVGSSTPFAAVFACGLIATLAAGLFPIEVLGELISIGTLSSFAFVCSGVLFLRITRPELERPFKTPFAPFVCISGVLICAILAFGLPATTWRRFLFWTALGAGIYMLYGRRHRVRESFTRGNGVEIPSTHIRFSNIVEDARAE
jgi:APA family basic amino acid/polyamine antiporter